MESSDTAAAPEGGRNSLLALPTKPLTGIIEYLTIEPDVNTTSDKTVQRRQNLSRFSLVCKTLHQMAKPSLYKNVHISTDRQLLLFFRNVCFRTETAELVETLSLNLELCGGNASGLRNRDLCLAMYGVLNSTTKVELLSLRLMECNCCFRNSSLQDVAVNGAKAGYDLFYEKVTDRIRDESNVAPKSRTFLPNVRVFDFDSTEIPWTYGSFFKLRGWNVLGQHGTQQPDQ